MFIHFAIFSASIFLCFQGFHAEILGRKVDYWKRGQPPPERMGATVLPTLLVVPVFFFGCTWLMERVWLASGERVVLGILGILIAWQHLHIRKLSRELQRLTGKAAPPTT